MTDKSVMIIAFGFAMTSGAIVGAAITTAIFLFA